MSKYERITRISDDHAEKIDAYSGVTNDVVIMAREAARMCAVDGLASVEIVREMKETTITIRVKR